MEETGPPAEDCDKDDQESRELCHHFQFVSRGVHSPPVIVCLSKNVSPEKDHAKNKQRCLPGDNHHSKFYLLVDMQMS